MSNDDTSWLNEDAPANTASRKKQASSAWEGAKAPLSGQQDDQPFVPPGRSCPTPHPQQHALVPHFCPPTRVNVVVHAAGIKATQAGDARLTLEKGGSRGCVEGRHILVERPRSLKHCKQKETGQQCVGVVGSARMINLSCPLVALPRPHTPSSRHWCPTSPRPHASTSSCMRKVKATQEGGTGLTVLK